jgi:hypothetical protein
MTARILTRGGTPTPLILIVPLIYVPSLLRGLDPACQCHIPEGDGVRYLKEVRRRLVDSFPAVVVVVWGSAFAWGGTTLPIQYESWWRLAMMVVVVANLAVALFPYGASGARWRFSAGVVTVTWLMVWVGYLLTGWARDDAALTDRLSVWVISQFAVMAVFVAWSYGRVPMREVVELRTTDSPDISRDHPRDS